MNHSLTKIQKLSLEMRGWIHTAEDFGFDVFELLGEEKLKKLELLVERAIESTPELSMTDEEARKFVECGLNECADRFIQEVDQA